MESNRIKPEELTSLADYGRARLGRRAAIIRVRERRRVEIGPWVSVVFENREAVLYQIQEMLHIERITDAAAIRHEIETYEELLPGPGELSGTLFVEIADEAQRRAALPVLSGIETSIALKSAGHRVAGEDKRPIAPAFVRPRAACVYYLRFAIPDPAKAALASGAETWLEVNHPQYAHAARLSPELVKELAAEL